MLQIADDPTVAHLDLLGPVPASPTGRAVWCHQANQLERHRDLNGSDEAAWSQLVDDLDETPTLIRIAERRLPLLRPTNDPGTWCRLTELAVEISESVMSRAAERFGPEATSGIELDL